MRPTISTPSLAQRRKNRIALQQYVLDEAESIQVLGPTSLITLWHQIVKYTFDNVWMDFLPGAWLVRVDDISASMTMGQPFSRVGRRSLPD